MMPFDGGDLADRRTAETGVDAGAHRLPVDMDGAGAALRDAASVLGAGEAELVADHPRAAGCPDRRRTLRRVPLIVEA